MISRRNKTLLSLTIFVGLLAWNVAAAAVKGETGLSVGDLTTQEIEEQLQVWHASKYVLEQGSLWLKAAAWVAMVQIRALDFEEDSLMSRAPQAAIC